MYVISDSIFGHIYKSNGFLYDEYFNQPPWTFFTDGIGYKLSGHQISKELFDGLNRNKMQMTENFNNLSRCISYLIDGTSTLKSKTFPSPVPFIMSLFYTNHSRKTVFVVL